MNKLLLKTLVVLMFILVIGCEDYDVEDSEIDPDANWRDISIKDVNSGEEFSIGEFQDKKVLIHVFAVWCTSCWLQGEQLKELEENDNLVFVSLDADPNEDETILTEYIGRLDFNWRFVNSPPYLTRSLIDEFGVAVVNPPWDPIILVCEDKSARLLGKGVKSAETLREEIKKGCD